MKKIVITLLLLFSLKSYGQIVVGILPPFTVSSTDLEKGLVIGNRLNIWPFQKVEFEIIVKTPKTKVVITNRTGKILYETSGTKGRYQYITDSSRTYLNVEAFSDTIKKALSFIGYREANNFYYDQVFGRSDAFNDAEVKITSIMLPIKTKNKNQCSVRFADLEYQPRLLIGPLVISLNKYAKAMVTPPAGVLSYDEKETDTISNVSSYYLIRKFITHSNYIKNDTTGADKRYGDVVFTFDHKKAYYISQYNAVNFFKDLGAFMKEKNAGENLLKYFAYFYK
jgi:hypothetical protein